MTTGNQSGTDQFQMRSRFRSVENRTSTYGSNLSWSRDRLSIDSQVKNPTRLTARLNDSIQTNNIFPRQLSAARVLRSERHTFTYSDQKRQSREEQTEELSKSKGSRFTFIQQLFSNRKSTSAMAGCESSLSSSTKAILPKQADSAPNRFEKQRPPSSYGDRARGVSSTRCEARYPTSSEQSSTAVAADKSRAQRAKSQPKSSFRENRSPPRWTSCEVLPNSKHTAADRKYPRVITKGSPTRAMSRDNVTRCANVEKLTEQPTSDHLNSAKAISSVKTSEVPHATASTRGRCRERITKLSRWTSSDHLSSKATQMMSSALRCATAQQTRSQRLSLTSPTTSSNVENSVTSSDYGEWLRANIHSIQHHMTPSSRLIDKLLSAGLLDEYEKQQTESMKTPIDKSRAILLHVAGKISYDDCLYERFLHVLEHNGNRYVASFLRARQQDGTMCTIYEEVINKYKSKIVECLYVGPMLLSMLESKQIITKYERETLDLESHPYDKGSMLLDLLKRFSADDWQIIIEQMERSEATQTAVAFIKEKYDEISENWPEIVRQKLSMQTKSPNKPSTATGGFFQFPSTSSGSMTQLTSTTVPLNMLTPRNRSNSVFDMAERDRDIRMRCAVMDRAPSLLSIAQQRKDFGSQLSVSSMLPLTPTATNAPTTTTCSSLLTSLL